MRALIAWALIAALSSSGCAGLPALSRTAMRARLAPRFLSRQDTVATPKEAAQQIPLGSGVRVKLLSGEKVEGKLRAVTETGVTIEKYALRYTAGDGREVRTPAENVEIAYEAMQSIQWGMSRGARIAVIAAAIGGGLLLALALSWGAIQQAS